LPLHTLPANHHAVAYLRGRGYDTDRLSRELHVSYCPRAYPEFPLAYDRVIVPVHCGGRPVGWQARYVGEPPAGVPKYYTMPGMAKGECLYNFDAASAHPFVVVCEGVSDVWSFGSEAVALFGKAVSGPQARLIASTWGQGVAVVMLDGDAAKEAREVHDALRGVRRRVVVALPPDGDPGDYPREELRRFVFGEALRQGVDLGASAATG
jgi:hypothetical protein